MDVFLDCLFDKDYRRLIIEGDASEETLVNTWNKLHAEYTALSMSDSQHDEMLIIKDINELNAKCVLVDCAVQHLMLCYDKRVVEMLNELKLKCDIQETDTVPEAESKLSKVVSRAKKWVAESQRLQSELNKIQDRSKPESGRSYFSKALLLLSKENGYAMREKDITVSQFVTAINMMNSRIKAEKQKK